MEKTSFYTEEELKEFPFLRLGEDVRISRKASIYGIDQIAIGNHVRIDDFCILSGKIELGNYIHVAAYTALYGGGAGIYIRDFANLSSRVCVYAVSDDYSGETMTSPMVPEQFKNVQEEPVEIKRHVIVGTGSVVLPGVILEEGTAVGSMGLVKHSTEAWGIYAGVPVRRIKERSRNLLNKEAELTGGSWRTETRGDQP